MKRGLAPVASERLLFLEGMRGLAALYVVLGHFCSMVDPGPLIGRPSTAPPWLQLLLTPLRHGHLAVATFIVLSGFCLQLALFQSGDGRVHQVADFFRRRARRILPAYYACLAFSIWISLTVTPQLKGVPTHLYLPVTTENVLAHVFLVHNLSPDWMYKLNGVLWSIAIEAQLYLVFPALVAWQHRKGPLPMALAVMAGVTFLIWWVPGATKLYPWYAALFAVGMASAMLVYRPHLRRGHSPRLAKGVVFGCLGSVVPMTLLKAPMPLADAVMGVGVAALCYSGTISPRAPWRGWFEWRPVVGLGTISYSLYLFHHPLQQCLFLIRPRILQTDPREMAYLVVVGLPLILACSALAYQAFERPFLRRRAAGSSSTRYRAQRVIRSLPLRVAHKGGSPPPSARESAAQPQIRAKQIGAA